MRALYHKRKKAEADKKRQMTPEQFDPTRTGTLRHGFASKLRQQFGLLRRAVVDLVLLDDAFGLKVPSLNPFKLDSSIAPVRLTQNAGQWKFQSNPQKVDAFKVWMKAEVTAKIRSKKEEALWEAYIKEGHKKGMARSFDDVKAKQGSKLSQKPDFYQGTKAQFLATGFNTPVTVEKLKLLVGRSFDDLEGITADMSNRMTRILADGLVQGKSPHAIAKQLSDEVNLGLERAETIARTELIRAHAEGQLDAMEAMGVGQVGAAVEWATAAGACPLCAALKGIVLKLSEARGMIPRHPRCRCAWIPWLGLDDDGQKVTKGRIDAAIAKSRKLADDDFHAGAKISKARPEDLLASLLTNSEGWVINIGRIEGTRSRIMNAFCPTGPGGGINPHCSPGSSVGYGKFSGHISPTFNIHTGDGVSGYLKSHLDSDPKTKLSKSQHDKIIAMNPHGVKNGEFKTAWVTKEQLVALKAILPAGTKIKQGTYDPATKDLKKSTPGGKKPPTAPTPPTPVPAHPVNPAHAHLPVVPMAHEHHFETGKPAPGILNGVPFAPAPAKFWEHTKDVDIKEPAPLKPIDRVGVMIKEADGRVWIVQPTGQFGNRKFTLPGGGVEKGLTNQQNALKEVWEETGLQVKITGHLGDFKDSNNGNNGRLYVGERIGGQPWDAKIEAHIRHPVTGKPAAESEKVSLVTKEKAVELLHRTDDLAQMATVHPIPLSTKTSGQMMDKLVNGLQPAASQYQGKGGAGNAELFVVQHLRGFSEKPALLTKKDMDDLVKKGDHIEVLRGISGHGSKTGKDLAEQFRTGDHYPGFGIFGSGSYFDSTKGGNNVAGSSYGAGSGGAVVRAALPKTAKIVQQSDLETLVPARPVASKHGTGGAGTHTENWRGVQAALAGFDAIHVDGKSPTHGSYGNRTRSETEGFYIILNRSILTVQKEDAKGHVIR